jgi:hypothetical protein
MRAQLTRHQKIGQMVRQTGHLHKKGGYHEIVTDAVLSKRSGTIVMGVTCAGSSLATRKLGGWSGRLGTFMKVRLS